MRIVTECAEESIVNSIVMQIKITIKITHYHWQETVINVGNPYKCVRVNDSPSVAGKLKSTTSLVCTTVIILISFFLDSFSMLEAARVERNAPYIRHECFLGKIGPLQSFTLIWMTQIQK